MLVRKLCTIDHFEIYSIITLNQFPDREMPLRNNVCTQLCVVTWSSKFSVVRRATWDRTPSLEKRIVCIIHKKYYAFVLRLSSIIARIYHFTVQDSKACNWLSTATILFTTSILSSAFQTIRGILWMVSCGWYPVDGILWMLMELPELPRLLSTNMTG